MGLARNPKDLHFSTELVVVIELVKKHLVKGSFCTLKLPRDENLLFRYSFLHLFPLCLGGGLVLFSPMTTSAVKLSVFYRDLLFGWKCECS